MVERCLPNRFPTWRTDDQPESPTYSWKQCAPSLCQAIIIPRPLSTHSHHPGSGQPPTEAADVDKCFAVLIPPQPPARCLGCGQASTCRLVIRNRIPPTESMGMARKSSIAEPETKTEVGGFTVWLKHRASNSGSHLLPIPDNPGGKAPILPSLLEIRVLGYWSGGDRRTLQKSPESPKRVIGLGQDP